MSSGSRSGSAFSDTLSSQQQTLNVEREMSRGLLSVFLHLGHRRMSRLPPGSWNKPWKRSQLRRKSCRMCVTARRKGKEYMVLADHLPLFSLSLSGFSFPESRHASFLCCCFCQGFLHRRARALLSNSSINISISVPCSYFFPFSFFLFLVFFFLFQWLLVIVSFYFLLCSCSLFFIFLFLFFSSLCTLFWFRISYPC